MTMKVSDFSDETEESEVSGECDESESCLIDNLEAQNQRLRLLLKQAQDIAKAQNELIMSMQGQLDLLRKQVLVSNPGPSERLPGVG